MCTVYSFLDKKSREGAIWNKNNSKCINFTIKNKKHDKSNLILGLLRSPTVGIIIQIATSFALRSKKNHLVTF